MIANLFNVHEGSKIRIVMQKNLPFQLKKILKVPNQLHSNHYYRQETKGEGKQKVQQEEEKAQK